MSLQRSLITWNLTHRESLRLTFNECARIALIAEKTFSQRNLRFGSYIKDPFSPCSIYMPLITDSLYSYIIPKKSHSWHVREGSDKVVRGALKIDHVTRRILPVAVLKNKKDVIFSDNEKLYLSMFNGMRGHLRVHTRFVRETEEGEKSYVITDFYDKTLRDLIRENISDDNLISIALDIASALVIAHHNGVIHNDIKLDNVVVRSNGNGKYSAALIDWSRAYDGVFPFRVGLSSYGTSRYTSPELLKKTERVINMQTVECEKPHDVYAFGILLSNLLLSRQLNISSLINSVDEESSDSDSELSDSEDSLRDIEKTSPQARINEEQSHEIVSLQSSGALGSSEVDISELEQCQTLPDKVKWFIENEDKLTDLQNFEANAHLVAAYEIFYSYIKDLSEEILRRNPQSIRGKLLGIAAAMVHPQTDSRININRAWEKIRSLEPLPQRVNNNR